MALEVDNVYDALDRILVGEVVPDKLVVELEGVDSTYSMIVRILVVALEGRAYNMVDRILALVVGNVCYVYDVEVMDRILVVEVVELEKLVVALDDSTCNMVD